MAKIDQTRLWVTTEDNPFDPFLQGDRWSWYDKRMGYHTAQKVAADSRYSFDLTPGERRIAINQACIDLVTDETRNFVFTLDGKYRFFYVLCKEGEGIPWGVTDNDDKFKGSKLSATGLITNGVRNLDSE